MRNIYLKKRSKRWLWLVGIGILALFIYWVFQSSPLTVTEAESKLLTPPSLLSQEIERYEKGG